MVITSRQNESVKRVCSLKNKKFRSLYGEYFAEGEKLVYEAFLTGQNVLKIFVTEKEEAFACELISRFSERYSETEITVVSESVFAAISDESTPQGVLAVIKIPENPPIGRLTRCLLLDRLQDPSNVGAILRLAAAAGVTCVFALSCADPFSPKALRASMGGAFRVTVYESEEREIISTLKKAGVPLICADMNGENVFELTPPEKFCLCVGNEGGGVSDYIEENANLTVKVPMHCGVESLNVSVAAGITLYALTKGK